MQISTMKKGEYVLSALKLIEKSFWQVSASATSMLYPPQYVGQLRKLIEY